jgi:hypothetical protein
MQDMTQTIVQFFYVFQYNWSHTLEPSGLLMCVTWPTPLGRKGARKLDWWGPPTPIGLWIAWWLASCVCVKWCWVLPQRVTFIPKISEHILSMFAPAPEVFVQGLKVVWNHFQVWMVVAICLLGMARPQQSLNMERPLNQVQFVYTWLMAFILLF